MGDDELLSFGYRFRRYVMNHKAIMAIDTVIENVLRRIVVVVDGKTGEVRLYRVILRSSEDGESFGAISSCQLDHTANQWEPPSPTEMDELSVDGFPVGLLFDLLDGVPDPEELPITESDPPPVNDGIDELDDDTLAFLRRVLGEDGADG